MTCTRGIEGMGDLSDHPPIECYTKGDRDTGLTFITKAPDRTLIAPSMLNHLDRASITVTGEVTLHAANGHVVYAIEGMTRSGNLRCRKTEDTLTP